MTSSAVLVAENDASMVSATATPSPERLVGTADVTPTVAKPPSASGDSASETVSEVAGSVSTASTTADGGVATSSEGTETDEMLGSLTRSITASAVASSTPPLPNLILVLA